MKSRIRQPFLAKVCVLLGDTLISICSLLTPSVIPLWLQGGGRGRSVFAVALLLPGFSRLAALVPAPSILGFVLLVIGAFYFLDLYDLRIFTEANTLFSRLCLSGMIVLIAAKIATLRPGAWPNINVLQSVAATLLLSFLWRRFALSDYALLAEGELTAVIGAGPGAELVRAILQQPRSPYRFAGFLYEGPHTTLGAEVLGPVQNLRELVKLHGIRQLVLATESLPRAVHDQLDSLRGEGIRLNNSSEIAMEMTQSIPMELVRHCWHSLEQRSDLWKRHLIRKWKRASDVVLSLAMLILNAPLLVLCALFIRLGSPGPVIFRQRRVGWHGREFTIFKLRTMRHDSESAPQWAQENDPRITRFGKFLRLTHIDELPQLVNVLRGEMSFVGPRPERPEFVAQLRDQIPYYDARHFLLPGITGWAQVNFRYGASVADSRTKLEYDLYYVMNVSPLLDLVVALKTIWVVLLMRGSR
jgi:exopolysaccharide biosynthesis polyprenyl glycosylphosphotransferase